MKLRRCSRCKQHHDNHFKYYGGVFCKDCEAWIKASVKEGKLPR